MEQYMEKDTDNSELELELELIDEVETVQYYVELCTSSFHEPQYRKAGF
jgi:hypothetical protein